MGVGSAPFRGGLSPPGDRRSGYHRVPERPHVHRPVGIQVRSPA
ncbi:hypothetical protein [Methanoculleus chikugoensis]|nr:hypothetical protein [Methanoculleus chikugoensis]